MSILIIINFDSPTIKIKAIEYKKILYIEFYGTNIMCTIKL